VLVITDNRPAHRSQSVARYLASIQGRLQLFFPALMLPRAQPGRAGLEACQAPHGGPPEHHRPRSVPAVGAEHPAPTPAPAPPEPRTFLRALCQIRPLTCRPSNARITRAPEPAPGTRGTAPAPCSTEHKFRTTLRSSLIGSPPTSSVARTCCKSPPADRAPCGPTQGGLTGAIDGQPEGCTPNRKLRRTRIRDPAAKRPRPRPHRTPANDSVRDAPDA